MPLEGLKTSKCLKGFLFWPPSSFSKCQASLKLDEIRLLLSTLHLSWWKTFVIWSISMPIEFCPKSFAVPSSFLAYYLLSNPRRKFFLEFCTFKGGASALGRLMGISLHTIILCLHFYGPCKVCLWRLPHLMKANNNGALLQLYWTHPTHWGFLAPKSPPRDWNPRLAMACFFGECSNSFFFQAWILHCGFCGCDFWSIFCV